ncbi:hypothetical protein A2673_01075 [Candidatus Kaiserbacteria bacterium RIFCSPHIGHO2_01_FULL_50_13]|uniref:ATP-cone domain-containing protein n=1 Tax=Candidatus Kaiserbacteria bacterium RIFCSPLOWO2_01_FULL_50_24 TaxID=1798507 RepID=A0A1F6ENN7_9BACT|nr:MAG: hypothetical protein A2673_01075 [Candidatus Kaiserbacteria bacterium RIFCSPHIGHO2_01_FULL_50_13]OGG74932.1 MAG: hypothetical protein A3A34_03895 [Candidatus Kaiserbacteria bacterium RIFCSPLOWO2_01_FULL_50_24]OGG81734.1 MAG: hypothetical protein A3H74_00970 [Candidatus Kaiserbacteria bacterium RIFCSPLOWO2_02_FULL_51_13]
MSYMLITKADGEQEPFSPDKLRTSLRRAGASKDAEHNIVERITNTLRPHITTGDIYRQAFDELRRVEEKPIAARYSIKRAILDLGPSGFPFEQFFAEVLRAHGWVCRVGVALTGRCAPHEVDVVAEKNGKRVGVEAKFHNDAGGKTDIKDALYVKARFDDLHSAPENSSRTDEYWLVTNTRFTRNAIRYAQCSNLNLIGWDYPRSRNLLTLIEEAHVHPLTCLTTLSEGEKKRLLDQRVVLCKSVQTPHVLKEHGVQPNRIPEVLDEARRLCGPHTY